MKLETVFYFTASIFFIATISYFLKDLVLNLSPEIKAIILTSFTFSIFFLANYFNEVGK